MFIVSGLSGSGKTTLCQLLAAELGVTPVRTSDFLIEALEERRTKEGRLDAWAHRRVRLLRPHELAAGRTADARHADLLMSRSGGVHESLALPLLVAPGPPACRILLDVAAALRYERVAARHHRPVLAVRPLVRRKDRQTKRYLRRVYGLRFGSPAHLSHYDVVISTDATGLTRLDVRSADAATVAALDAAVRQLARTHGGSRVPA